MPTKQAPPEQRFAAEIENLGKTYYTQDEQIQALTDVSKQFLVGAITAVVGPSGSGKSSLLRILACNDKPTSGTAHVAGEDLSQLRPRGRRELRRRSVAYMFQDPSHNLIDYLPAIEQLDLAAKLRGTRSNRDEQLELLDTLGMAHRADHLPVQLSGGEQQRLSVACAVIGTPALVIADEPTAELDTHSAGLVMDAFAALRSTGVAFLLASHDQHVIERADHLLRLEKGVVSESW
ncbi:MAG: ATP-binding cassette domain-containing protein [Antricoccus sp.]